MSRIEELIEHHCPDGVSFGYLWQFTAWDKKFNAVESYKQAQVNKYKYLLASDLKKMSVEFGGTVKLLSTGSDDQGWTTEELAEDFLAEGEIVAIPWGGKASVQYFRGKFVTADNRIASSLDVETLDNKFLFYLMLGRLDEIQSYYRGSGIQHPSMAKILDMRIPVPPIEVQREIVDILDKFTQLEAELEAELEARRKQYEHYRNELLSFKNIEGGVRWFSVDEICDVTRGKVMSKDYLREHPGPYPVYSSQTLNSGIFGLIDTYDFDYESITWTTDGANAGSVFYHIDEKFSLTNVCGLLKVLKPDELSTRYLFFQLGRLAKSHVSAGMGNPKLMATAMKAIRIPVPPMKMQIQIVEALDKLDEIVESISSGLPAEIAARRQQNEYYRDKLLTFKELEVA